MVLSLCSIWNSKYFRYISLVWLEVIVSIKNIADAPDDIRNLIGDNQAVLVLEESADGCFGTSIDDLSYSLNVYTK